MAVLIGSKALKHWYSNFPISKHSDFDIIVSENEYKNFGVVDNTRKTIIRDQKLEIETDCLASNRYIIEKCQKDSYIVTNDVKCYIAQPDLLVSIKHSHRHFEDHWHKNIKHYNFLRSMGAVVDDHLSSIRNIEKQKRSGFRPMNISNTDFFQASEKFVNRIFVHDDIHYATCYYDAPLWSRCKKNMDLAKIDFDLFKMLDYADQVKMVQEEAFVIALERRIIPKSMKYGSFSNSSVTSDDIASSYAWAVMRIGTTLTSGWFREFTIDNYVKVMKHSHDFVGKFVTAFESGKIRKNEAIADT